MKYILFLLISSSILFAQQNKVPKILFSSNRDTTTTQPSLYIMNPDGTDIERFIDSIIGFQPRISNDGKKITYTGTFNDTTLGPPQIHVMNIDGSDDHVVSLCNVMGNWEPCVIDHYNPAFSPDGQFVAYHYIDEWIDSDIFIVSSDTINGFYKKALTGPPYNEFFIDWSPTEDRLLLKAYFFNDTIDYDGEIFSMDSNGDTWIRLTNDNFINGSARFSPDGERVAYVSNNQEDKWEIYLMNKDGGNKIQLTNNEIDEGFYGLSWVPNGQSILFGADDQIFSLDIETGNITQMTNDEHSNRYPEWIEIDLTNVNEKNIKPIRFSLFNVYPNPFNPTTTIEYQLPIAAKVSLKLYDMLGSEVATLVNETKDAGFFKYSFNGSSLASGTYFLRMQANDFVQTKKLTLMK